MILASGFIFDSALISRDDLLARLRATWSPTARLARDGTRWILINIPSRRVDPRQTWGQPLHFHAGRWLATELPEERLAGFPVDTIIEQRGGLLTATAFSSLTPAHPVELLGLEAPRVLAVHTLAPPPVKVIRAVAAAPATIDDLLPATPAPAAPASAAPATLWQRVRDWFTGENQPARSSVNTPGFFERLFKPASPEERRKYLDELRQMFSGDELSEALRRAVPLSSGRTGGLPGPPTNVLPGRRNTLSLLTPNTAIAPSMHMERDEYEEMRAMYRAAAERLINEGKIDDAAYLLAKLLDDAPAAVALLEKHERFELAAQLATTQNLAPAERIRLWILAGRIDEAIRVARTSGDFATVINALKTRAPDQARVLRQAWGAWLAEHFRFPEAMAATAPLSTLPEDWSTWLDHAVDTGGSDAATAIAIDLGRSPERAPRARAQVHALLADDADPTLPVVTAEALLTHAPRADASLYRPLWRRLMREASAGTPVDRALVERVLTASADPSLRQDATVAFPEVSRTTNEPRVIAAPVVIGPQVFDVAPLAKGRRVHALGAAGLRIVSREGAVIRQHLIKADQLVVGPVGAPVLIISTDGMLTRVWKLDPTTFNVTSWMQAPLSAWSSTWDGLTWAVGMEGALVMLDPASPGPMEWWRVPRLVVTEVHALGSVVLATGIEGMQKETWNFAFHAEQQRMMQRLTPPVRAWSIDRQNLLQWEEQRGDDGQRRLIVPSRSLSINDLSQLTPCSAGVLIRTPYENFVQLSLQPWRGEYRTLARFEGFPTLALRELTPQVLAVGDDFGRVTELELRH